MLFVTLLSNFKAFDYVILGNFIGYSIITNVVFFYLFNFKGNYCWFTRNAPLFLLMINVIDIIGRYIDYRTYSSIFNISICTFSLTLFLINKIKRSIR